MSDTYTVISGDTFELIARKKYGTEQNASNVALANPGVYEPLTPGTELIIPEIPNAPKDKQQQTASNNNEEVALLIDGKRFKFWDKIRFTDTLDSIDIVEFSAPFDVNLPGFKETFRPFSYQSVVVTVGGDPIFTGTMLTPVPVIENDNKIISVSCYSLPGVLNDCTPPASMLDKLEFNDQYLREIITTLIAPFGIVVDIQADQGAIFEIVATDPDKKILIFIIELLKQRNLILTNDEQGKLVIWQSVKTGNPVAILRQGATPVLSVTPSFEPQNYYSHITGIDPVTVGLDGSQFTVKNPRLSGVVRPFIFKVPDTIDSTIKAAVEAKAGRMFGNLVSYVVRVNTWRDSTGNRWKSNTTIILQAPDAMIYNEYEFIIRSVDFEKDDKTETATLNLVLPGSFSGEIPDTLPWD